MRRFLEQAEKIKGPIADSLDGLLPSRGLVLEVACGNGAHVAYFARRFPHLIWQPSDPDPEVRRSIMAELEHSGLSNVRAPLHLDAMHGAWPISRADAVVCLNHTTLSAALALLERSAALLQTGLSLFVHGLYEPEQVRTLEKAAVPAFKLANKVEMNGSGYTLVFERCGSSGQSGSRPAK